MITVDLKLTGLPVRQHTGDDPLSVFALSTDDGENLIDDDEDIVETYNDGDPA